MTFPETPLDVTVEIDAGGWTDITGTGYVYDRDSSSIQIQRGRSSEAGQTERGTARMTLDNTGGEFSPRNPLSPYYGLIGRNTPLRVSVRQGDVFLDLPGEDTDKATAPDAAALGITGDIDIRIDATMSQWRAFTDLAAKYVETGNQRSWLLYVSGSGLVKLRWSADGTSTVLESASTLPVPASPGRRAIRATLDVNNGASGNTVTFYTSDTISGTWTQLGDPVVTAGTTSIFDSTAGLELGSVAGSTFDPLAGRLHAFELRSGIDGTVVANPDFTAQTAGASSFADTASSPNTWTAAGAASITNRHWRFHGEVSEWPVSWEASGNDVWTSIEASGILRRLSQGASPLRSAMYRTITGTGPVAYWSMEDKQGSTQAASGIQGKQPLRTTGTLDFAASEGPPGSASLADQTTTSRLSGTVPTGSTSSSWRIEYVVKFPDAASPLFTEPLVWQTAGSIKAWEIAYADIADDGAFLQYLDVDDNAGPAFQSFADMRDGLWHHVRISAEQVGSDIVVLVDFDGINAIAEVLAGETLGRITNVIVNPVTHDDELLPYSIGHVAVWAPWDSALSDELVLDAFAGHAEEKAGRRIERLCAEEGITFRAIGDLDDTEAMGAQSVATLLELVTECADADLGILYEPREVLGLGYRTRVSLYNQAARVELDYAAEHLSGPLDGVDDDQLTRNDITVTRKGGSSAEVEVTDGPLSVQDPPDGVGRYDDAVTINIESDLRLTDQAGWRANLGTVDEARYPKLEVNLASIAADTDLVAELLDFEFGDRVSVDSPPAWLPPEQISQLIQGYTESMRNFEHRMTLNASPEKPYRVAVYGTDRYDTAGSELAASLQSYVDVRFVADAETNNTVAGTSCAVNVPAGTKQGDVMVSLVGKIDPASITAPAGWTLIGTQTAGSNVIYGAYYRVALAGEPASYTWTWGVNAKNVGWIGAYRNADVSTPIAGSASTGTNVSGTAFDTPVPAVTVPQGGRTIRSVFERHAATGATNTWTISAGTERMDLGSNGGSGQDDSSAVYDVGVSTAGTPPVRTVTASQTVSQIALWTISLNPSPLPVMEISVATTSGPLWTTNPDDMPFDVMVGGERMTVEDPAGGLLDTFSRSVSNDWGTSTSGKLWTTSGGSASDYSVNGSQGLVSLGSVNVRRFVTVPAGPNVSIYDSVTVPVTATGGSISGGYVARFADDQNFYLYQILHDTVGTIDLEIVKRVAGAFTVLGNTSNILPYIAGVPTHVRCLCAGTTLAVKIWRDGTPEPENYQLTATDSTFTSGAVGTHSNLLSANTNTLPVVITYDNIGVTAAAISGTSSPQAVTVTRSVNGIAKAHASGAALSLADPVVYAL